MHWYFIIKQQFKELNYLHHYMKKSFKIFVITLIIIAYSNIALFAQCTDPTDPSCGSGCFDSSGASVDCDSPSAVGLPLDTNVFILLIVGIIIGFFMLRKKFNAASFQA